MNASANSRVRALLTIALIAFGRRAIAQATPVVLSTDPAYRAVGELYAAGLLDTLAVGTRPYSRAELVRLYEEASRRAAAGSGTLPLATRWALASLAERLRSWRIDSTRATTPLRLLDSWETDATMLQGAQRPIPGNGIGEIAADLLPLGSGNAGIPLTDGSTLAVESMHVLPVSRYGVIVARPRAYAWRPIGSGVRTAIRLHEVYARAVVGAAALSIGRQSIVWGEGRDGGMTFTTSAPALDMIRLGTDRPLVLPWLLRRVGPTSLDAFVADLGADQNFPHARLVGWRGTVRPARWVEISLHTLDQMGGRGAPAATLVQRVTDVFPLIGALSAGSDLTFSNKLAGGDLRFRLPGSHASELYFEETFDDFDIRRVGSSISQDGGELLGISSHLSSDGRLAWRLEGRHTGIRYYEHTQFASGVTMHRQLLGDPLGPHAVSGLISLEWQRASDEHTTLDFVLEQRSGDGYQFRVSGPNYAGFGFDKTLDLPEEHRVRLLVTDERALRGQTLRIRLQGGVERATNFAFRPGASRANFVARIAVARTMP